MSDEPIWYSIPVSGELYERLERAAKARGKTVDQLADEALQVSTKCECHQEAGDSVCEVHPPSRDEQAYAASIGAPYSGGDR